MRRFEFVEGTSSQFWEIAQADAALDIRWGRIGTAGQSQTKDFADAAKATAAMNKLISEKTGKGYVETTTGATAPATTPAAKAARPEPAAKPAAAPAPAAPVTTAAAAPPVAAKPGPAPIPVSTDTPPWLAAGEPFDLPKKVADRALPSRRFPAGPPKTHDPAFVWDMLRRAIKEWGRFSQEDSDPALWPALERARSRTGALPASFSAREDGLLLALASAATPYAQRIFNAGDLVDVLVAQAGLPVVVDIMIESQRYGITDEWNSGKRKLKLLPAGPGTRRDWWYGPLAHAGNVLRAHLSHAEPAVYAQCAQAIRAAVPTLDGASQVTLAMLLQDEPDLSDEVARNNAGANAPPELRWLQLTATAPDALRIARAAAKGTHGSVLDDAELQATYVRERGLAALPDLLPRAANEHSADALAAFGVPEAIDALARAASTSKGAIGRLAFAVERWPVAAIVALARLVGAGGSCAALAAPMLSRQLQAHRDAVPAVRPWIGAAGEAVVDRMLGQLDGPAATAPAEALPAVLASPPWLAAKNRKKADVLALEPLALPPEERWDPELRQQAIGSPDWAEKRRKDAQGDPKAMATEIGFDTRYSGNKEINQEAARAIAARDLDALVGCWRRWMAWQQKQTYTYIRVNDREIGWLPESLAVPYWNTIAADSSYTYNAIHIVARFGLRVLPGLQAVVRRFPADNLPVAMHIGDTSFAAPMARAVARLKTLRDVGEQWLLKFPEHAACGLIADAVGKPGEARDNAGVALRLLAAQGHRDLLMDVARRYGRDDVVAAVETVLGEDPLDRYPAKRPSLPAFWHPAAWRRPVLAAGPAAGMPLPDAALDALGAMLTFPTTEGVYSGIDHVRQACTADSLAEFSWDLFSAWLSAGAPSKEGWAFATLGAFGNDAVARKLTPYLRAWPGEAAHARAVAGLDVLAAIGTDVALMLLNGIAQKVKFKGLQDRAREKIDEIATARGLTVEELEDRLAPDLGLDEHGTLELDFGPRRFRVGFDEALRPYVRDADGARLPDLPKPKKTDDAALSSASVERFKQLKKDARTVAAQQVLRLELAMCARRRWTPDVFAQLMVAHPLVRHLVQRVAWGVYELPADDAGNFGGKLVAVFRVAEDGGYTTASDDPYSLPATGNLRIGVPHALELPAADAAAFGQLFADYELLQPFAQLGRETHALTDAERKSSALLRWKGRTVPTGRVLGLVNKGWRRGQAQDGGSIWFFNKPLGNGKVVELNFEPGIIVGLVDEHPEQNLQEVQFGTPSAWGDMASGEALAGLDAIAASELIRDLEALTG